MGIETAAVAALGGIFFCFFFNEMKNESLTFYKYTGQLKVLIFLHESGCEWNAAICENAAKSGSLACLKYLPPPLLLLEGGRGRGEGE